MPNAGYIESAALTSGEDSAYGVRGFDSRMSLRNRGCLQPLFPFGPAPLLRPLPLPRSIGQLPAPATRLGGN